MGRNAIEAAKEAQRAAETARATQSAWNANPIVATYGDGFYEAMGVWLQEFAGALATREGIPVEVTRIRDASGQTSTTPGTSTIVHEKVSWDGDRRVVEREVSTPDHRREEWHWTGERTRFPGGVSVPASGYAKRDFRGHWFLKVGDTEFDLRLRPLGTPEDLEGLREGDCLVDLSTGERSTNFVFRGRSPKGGARFVRNFIEGRPCTPAVPRIDSAPEWLQKAAVPAFGLAGVGFALIVAKDDTIAKAGAILIYGVIGLLVGKFVETALQAHRVAGALAAVVALCIAMWLAATV